MDKRSLLFVFSLTITLLLVNMFFNYRSTQEMEDWKKQQEIKKEQQKKHLEADVQQRMVTLEAFPLTDIYLKRDDFTPAATGITVGHSSVITFSWDDTPPEQVFIRSTTSAETKKDIVTLGVPHHALAPGSIIAYHTDSDEQIIAAPLPKIGSFDLHLLTLAPDLQVALGEYRDGHFALPFHHLDHDAIAFREMDGSFYPAGIYLSGENILAPLSTFASIDYTIKKQPSVVLATDTEETFYLLENEYQQLLFSNYGGALVEINLPFQSDDNELSVVKEIEFDRDIEEHSKPNSQFPLFPHYTHSDNPYGTFTWNDTSQIGGYYPLLRRPLITGNTPHTCSPEHYALNIVSDFPEMASLPYRVVSFTDDTIVFEAVQKHRKITKTFTLSKNAAPYCIDIDIKIEGYSEGLWLTSGIPEVELISGGAAPSAKYKITRGVQSEVETIKVPKKGAVAVSSLNPDWICNSNGFFGLVLDPLLNTTSGYKIQHYPGSSVPTRLTEVDKDVSRFKADSYPGYAALVPLAPSGGTIHLRLYAGPFEEDVLKAADAHYANHATGYSPEYYKCRSYHGWFKFISAPFAKFLLIIMKFFHSTTGSWTLSIILLTIILRVFLYPLNAWSIKSMKRMQEVAPAVTAIQEKYKKDPKRAQMEVMNLYRKEKVNPFTGCFPMLIQMPFLIGMFDLLKSTFALRGETFIPGWIDNLTSPDVLFKWKTSLLLIGNEFHLLPILLGGIMFLQQRLSSALPSDSSKLTDQQRQQKSMGMFMTFFFMIMFYKLPSGLNIYWLCSMSLSMAQQWWIKRSVKTPPVEILPKN